MQSVSFCWINVVVVMVMVVAGGMSFFMKVSGELTRHCIKILQESSLALHLSMSV
jgi:hypothetical protein